MLSPYVGKGLGNTLVSHVSGWQSLPNSCPKWCICGKTPYHPTPPGAAPPIFSLSHSLFFLFYIPLSPSLSFIVSLPPINPPPFPSLPLPNPSLTFPSPFLPPSPLFSFLPETSILFIFFNKTLSRGFTSTSRTGVKRKLWQGASPERVEQGLRELDEQGGRWL